MVGRQIGTNAYSHFLLLTPCSLDPKAEEILQKYLQSKEDVTDAILQTDQTLSEKEKEIEGEEQVKRVDSVKSSKMFKLFDKVSQGSLNYSKKSKDVSHFLTSNLSKAYTVSSSNSKEAYEVEAGKAAW
jgi:hypothetical protein